MDNRGRYFVERVFLCIVILLGVAGFWDIYFGAGAQPTPYQHFHAVVNFAWLFLLLWQLSLVGNKQFRSHRKIGLSILVAGPLLVASTALLSVYSAYKGVASGEGDFLIVQNVGVTLELALL